MLYQYNLWLTKTRLSPLRSNQLYTHIQRVGRDYIGCWAYFAIPSRIILRTCAWCRCFNDIWQMMAQDDVTAGLCLLEVNLRHFSIISTVVVIHNTINSTIAINYTAWWILLNIVSIKKFDIDWFPKVTFQSPSWLSYRVMPSFGSTAQDLSVVSYYARKIPTKERPYKRSIITGCLNPFSFGQNLLGQITNKYAREQHTKGFG